MRKPSLRGTEQAKTAAMVKALITIIEMIARFIIVFLIVDSVGAGDNCFGSVDNMGKSDEERIRENEQRIEKLKAANARLKKQISDRARKLDTRRKIVAGAIVLKHAEIDKAFGTQLHELLDRFVIEHDRRLFDLPPKGKKPDAKSGKQQGGNGREDRPPQ